MSIRALSGFSPEWFEPPGQGKDSVKTRFKLRPLDGEQYSDVAEHMNLDSGRVQITARGGKICLGHGLVDWENFETTEGGVIEFSAVNFKLIDWLTRVRLVTKIIDISELNTEEKKT